MINEGEDIQRGRTAEGICTRFRSLGYGPQRHSQDYLVHRVTSFLTLRSLQKTLGFVFQGLMLDATWAECDTDQ